MRARRSAILAGCIVVFMVSAAGAHERYRDCDCRVVLNGCLNTADFDGGVGYGAAAEGGGGGVFVVGGSSAFASASAFAFARAHASVSFGRGMHGGMHGGGGGWGHR